jgi:hypothetical protein
MGIIVYVKSGVGNNERSTRNMTPLEYYWYLEYGAVQYSCHLLNSRRICCLYLRGRGVPTYLSDCIGFEVLTAVVMKSSVFWDITPCSSLKVNRCFGGTCRLHLQDRIISQERDNNKASRKKISASCWSLARLILRFWRRRWHVPPKRRLTFNGLHAFTS